MAVSGSLDGGYLVFACRIHADFALTLRNYRLEGQPLPITLAAAVTAGRFNHQEN